MNKCPCGSDQDISICCLPYLAERKMPETPEKLMRSRYVAYTRADIDYIQKTMCKKAAENYDPLSAKRWASSVQWLGLTVIDAVTSSTRFGTVTFFARFLDGVHKKFIYEKSRFEKINDVWFYVDGITLKAKQSDPCPCGSGAKLKKCCASL